MMLRFLMTNKIKQRTIEKITIFFCITALPLAIHCSYASTANLDKANQIVEEMNQSSYLLFKDNGSGQKEVELFKNILMTDKLFQLLIALYMSVPEVTEQLKYTALFYEVQKVNQNLSQLMIAVKENNQLVRKTLMQKGEIIDR
ncbi:TPA: hypothetical protein ACTUT5_003036 [Legionella anisa]|uniref:hypothetical protein n=1 Tax=Legionella anisa TaxID=28082 RepID=UPI001981D8B3|nr:hypothetical protein [Legionella anisa]MBN5937174.1 hypothetical protein [Legionella anisa]